MTLQDLFTLRGKLSTKIELIILSIGTVLAVLAWHGLSALEVIPKTILPPPLVVLASFGTLYEKNLIGHMFTSVQLNFFGYVEAILISIPLGFVLGLFPLFDALSSRLLATLRFAPLPAAMGIFIASFGISSNMKIQFLAVGIIVYLLPTVIQRVKETQEVYVQTIKTLGATKWQQIRNVFLPDVLGRVFDDIRVLVAISWTYITISEVVNSSEGGLGALAYIAQRQGRVDEIWAILVVILTIGFFQDLLFKFLDKMMFPYKHSER